MKSKSVFAVSSSLLICLFIVVMCINNENITKPVDQNRIYILFSLSFSRFSLSINNARAGTGASNDNDACVEGSFGYETLERRRKISNSRIATPTSESYASITLSLSFRNRIVAISKSLALSDFSSRFFLIDRRSKYSIIKCWLVFDRWVIDKMRMRNSWKVKDSNNNSSVKPIASKKRQYLVSIKNLSATIVADKQSS